MSYVFTHGTGTEADPYQVWNADDLNGVRDYLDAHFIQMADIDLNGYQNWIMIGAGAEETDFFSGVYDGNGFTVSNLTTNNIVDWSGLFGVIIGESSLNPAIIKNLGLLNVDVTGHTYTGALVGYSFHGNISSCYSTGTVITTGGGAGGLVGLYGEGVISNCFSRCSVEGFGSGGILGVSDSNTINKCYGAAIIDEDLGGGGIVSIHSDNRTTVTDCYFDSSKAPNPEGGKGTPKTTLEMKQQSTYEGWDFDTVWGIDPAINDGYPYLQVFENVETPAYEFTYGTGTEADPYQVWNADDLNGVRDYLSAYFIQMADIDLVEWANWIPIGSVDPVEGDFSLLFTGSYDGNGFTISNLKCNNDFASGLFMGIQNGTVKKLGVTNCDIKGDLLAGAISAFLMDNACIDSCFSTGIVSSHPIVYISLGSSSGGIVGSVDSMTGDSRGIISNCFSKCTVHTRVEITAQQQSGFAGGIVGGFGSATLENCFSIGLIDVGEEEYYSSGGLIGQLRAGNTIVTNSYYDSETSGQLDDDGKGTPKTTAEMKLQETFVNWDFTDIWGIGSTVNDGYPYLLAFESDETSENPEEPSIITGPVIVRKYKSPGCYIGVVMNK